MPSGLHTWSTTAASNNSADSAVNYLEGQAPSSVNDSARAAMAVIAKWRDDNSGSLATGGTSTAYTLTTNTVFTTLALMDNATIAFIPHTDSGATPTLNVDGLGAKTIRNWTGATFPTGGLKSGSVYRATYDNGNAEWLIHNSPGVLQANQVTTAAITDAAVTLAKLDNLAASTFIGRYTASTGVPQALTLSTGLTVNTSTGAVTTTTNPTFLPNFLSGLTLSTAGSSTTMAIASGAANDSTNTTIMKLSSALNKTTASWTVGTNQGGLDTGSIANSTWYHFYAIYRADTAVTDIVFSTSASSPTLPTNYTLYRRIGSGKTDGSGNWTAFTQFGDRFIWGASVSDGFTAGTASRNLGTLTVPTGVNVTALFRSFLSAPGVSVILIYTSPSEADTVPATVYDLAATPSINSGGQFAVMTDTSARIGARANTSVTANVYTYGWIDTRGKQ